MLVECNALSVDNQAYGALQNYDDKVIFRLSGLAVYDVVRALDFTRKNIAFYISDLLDCLLSKDDCRLDCFDSFFLHGLAVESAKICKLAVLTKTMAQITKI